jgi:DNA (cytosine-5)-methyltransferase 1
VLVHGVPADVAASKAFGNAIVPQIAAEFVGAYMQCRP